MLQAVPSLSVCLQSTRLKVVITLKTTIRNFIALATTHLIKYLRFLKDFKWRYLQFSQKDFFRRKASETVSKESSVSYVVKESVIDNVGLSVALPYC